MLKLTKPIEISFGAIPLEAKKKNHLLKWEITSKLKGLEGLGLKNSSYMNDAFMTKLKWKIETHTNKPWITIFNHKYRNKHVNYKKLFLHLQKY